MGGNLEKWEDARFHYRNLYAGICQEDPELVPLRL